jgi:HK97 family phage prohead protease
LKRKRRKKRPGSRHKEREMEEIIIEKCVRSCEAVIRMSFDDPHKKKIYGLAIPYNRVSDNPLPESPSIKEKIAVGAFKRSVGNDDIQLLWQHNDLYVLGRNRAGTLTLTEDENGVSFENVPPDSDWFKGLELSIKRRDISHMSFRFGASVHYERMTDGSYLQIVDEGRLDEISIVRKPVYLSTTVYARSPEGVLLVNNKPVEIVDPNVKNFKPQAIDPNVLWKRYDAIVAKNLGGK